MRLATEVVETESLFETLTNNSPVGLYIVQDGRFCYTNPTFQSTTGYKEDELLGRDALELVIPEDRKMVRENAIKMLKGELASPYQFRVTHKNGSIKWVMESVVSVQYRGRWATLGNFVDITERKRMEEALQDSEEKLRKMFESVTDGISVIDLKGSITEANQRTVEMHGFSSKDELQGKNALELLAPHDHKRIAANTKKVIKQGAIRGVEYTLLRADGSEFPGELSTNVLKDASGNLSGHITIVRDITKRKQAEEKMQHLNLVLRAIRNINKLIARGTDRDNLLKGACDTFVKTSGYYGAWIALLDESGKLITAAEAGLGKSFLQVMERLKRGELTHCGCKVLEKPGVLVMKDVSSECADCPVAKKEDTSRGAISVRLEYSGKVYGLMTVYIPPGRAAEKEERNMLDEIAGDIGFALHSMEQEQERKRVEEVLRDSEEKLWKIFESATDGISVIDLEGSITEVNQRTVEMHGFSSKDELRGKNALELLAPRDHKRIAANMKKVIKQGAIRGVEYTLLRADGSEFPGELSTNALKNASGNLSGHITIVRDITERKQAEEKVQHLNLVLRAIRNINQLIARGTDRDSLLKGACDTFVKTRGYYGAWIALLDESGKLVTAAEAGLGKSFLQVTERLKRGELTHCGYKVLEKPGVLVMKDVSSECEDCPVAKEDTGRGAMSVSLEHGGKVYGLMTVSTPPGRAVEKEEHALLEEIAGDIAFALHSMEQEQERKRAEEALRDSEEKLLKIFESATDGISVIDLKGIITQVNQRTVEMHGFSSKDELRGKNALELLAPRDHKKIAANMKKVIKQGAIRGVEYTLLRADGSEFPGELSTNALKDASGNPVGHITIVRDITERKRAEEALQAEKNKLQSLIDAMDTTLTIHDTEYNIIYQNEQSRIASGGAHLGEKCYRAYHSKEKLCDGCPVEKAFKDGKPHTIENKTVKPSGEVVFWEITANPIRDAGGKIVSCLELARDITERKQAEEALQAEKNKLQSVIDAMADALTIQDRDYNIIFQNELSRKSTDGDRMGEKCYRAYEGRESICESCPVEKAFKDGKPHTTERMRVLPSGEVTFWENTANPIRDAAGRVVSCLEIGRNITERKKQEQALADELTRRRLLVDQSLDGIVVLDVDAKVVEANQSFAEMLGYTLEEVRELHTWDWDKNYSHEQILEMGQNVDEKGLHLETRHTRKDGSVIDVDISINGAMFGGQKLIFCVERDITERKRAAEAINLQRAYFQQLFDTSPDAIIMMDTNDRAIQINKGFEVLFGYSNEEVKGRSLIELIVPEVDIQEASDSLQGILGGEVIRKESVRRRKDGSLVEVSVLAYPIRANDKWIGAYGIYSDITERKQAEEALKQAAEEWRGTFDSITDAISIHDRDFRIQRANKAFADIFNVKPRQIIGRHCYELHKGGKPISGCPHKQTLATKQPAAAEFYESNLGKYFHESTSPIFDEKGEVVGTVHITRDITEQKQQNERLMMADRLASIGELAAGTAHELNNPLTSVIGFSQLVMEKDIPDDIREDLKIIHNEAQRAAGVTKNLLTFARKQAPVKQLNQINNIIEDVLKLRAYEHKVNGIEVKRQLAPDLPEIKVDSFQMQQVFLNITINAEYFMIGAHNRGTLTITTKKRNGNVRISIADDGPGIPPETLSRIFNPFFTTKEAGKGTGLGLSICHGIVSEHGGQIYARSQPGKGATIVVELPVNNSH